MAEYIEREALIDAMEKTDWYHISLQGILVKGARSDIHTPLYKESDVYRVINEAPAADVVEVRRGKIKWVNRPIAAQYATVTNEYGEKHYGKVCDRIENNPVGYCGECGKRLDDTFMNFCPNCGARMDGERRCEDG